MRRQLRHVLASASLALALAYAASAAFATEVPVGGPGSGPAWIPTGVHIDALAAPGAQFLRFATGVRQDGTADANQAMAAALSPDGKTLLVMTSGYNLKFSQPDGAAITYPVLDPTTGLPSSVKTPNAEWVFVYDVTGRAPAKRQQIAIPNTYQGIVWKPDGSGFYVSAGIDDRVYVYKRDAAGAYVADAPFVLLGHNANQTAPLPKPDGGLLKATKAGTATLGLLTAGAVVAHIGVSADGALLAAANFENDSVSLVDTKTRKVTAEVAFFKPGGSDAIGEYPFGVAVMSRPGLSSKVYVSSQRDDQVIAVDADTQAQRVIPVGKAPNALLLSADGQRLYVADGDADAISVIDTARGAVVATIALHPGDPFNGANPDALALSPDGHRLYVALGGENAVAVVDPARQTVLGLIPTGWYPNAVAVSKDGTRLFIVNGKQSPGPNPANGYTTDAGKKSNTTHVNEYGWALEKGGLLVEPVPAGETLAKLTAAVDENNGVANRRRSALMDELARHITHVIYITKENRTYDQILGDLPRGNGDKTLTEFPQPVTPNHHQLALDYVTFDNFYDPGESSGVGWNWSVQGHDNEFTEKSQDVYYGNAGFTGFTYDYQGPNRNVNLTLPQTASSPGPFDARFTGIFDPSGSSSILPGSKDVAGTEGDGDLSSGAVGGYLWDEALRHGKTVRDYGEHVDLTYYDAPPPVAIPIVRHPFEAHMPQSPPAKPALVANTDIYFRGFDQAAPDVYRVEEWEREFRGYVKSGKLPTLEVMTINHDHFGSFTQALEGLTNPTLQMADDDYSLGRIVQDVESSPFAGSTAIFINEDDSQTGPDHVDTHRSLLLVVSPYTRRNALVHTLYTTDNVIRTITDLLGLNHLGMQDANAAPMTDAFTNAGSATKYAAIVPGVLCRAPVASDLVPACAETAVKKSAYVAQRHDGAWWAAQTAGMDFSKPDAVDPIRFNQIVWRGIMGG
jgi:YVTN family beta-propeller protein